VNLKRLTDSHSANFLKFVLGLRPPATSVSSSEHQLLGSLARGRRSIIEVGVFEAATSRLFCQEMDPSGTLYLVDPFFPTVRLERLLNLSFTRWVATKTVAPWRSRVQFIRQPSRTAAEALPLRGQAQLIFIDARHDYESVLEDLHCWAPMLAEQGTIAFHDSRVCPARPDLHDQVGPVRLMREIAQGVHGGWQVFATADSITAVRRTDARSGSS
jgi:hypothetical protein